jgi:hypothetical protein
MKSIADLPVELAAACASSDSVCMHGPSFPDFSRRQLCLGAAGVFVTGCATPVARNGNIVSRLSPSQPVDPQTEARWASALARIARVDEPAATRRLVQAEVFSPPRVERIFRRGGTLEAVYALSDAELNQTRGFGERVAVLAAASVLAYNHEATAMEWVALCCRCGIDPRASLAVSDRLGRPGWTGDRASHAAAIAQFGYRV